MLDVSYLKRDLVFICLMLIMEKYGRSEGNNVAADVKLYFSSFPYSRKELKGGNVSACTNPG